MCIYFYVYHHSFDLSLVGLNTYLNTHNGRDKVGKLVQFIARGIAGYLADLKDASPKDSDIYAFAARYHTLFKNLFTRIMTARHTVRWLSSLGIIIALRSGNRPWGKDDNTHRAYVTSQLLLLWWHFFDHVRWLQQIEWLSGDANKMKNVAFTGFAMSAAISFAYNVKLYLNPTPDMLSDENRMQAVIRQIIKHGVTVVANLHISELYKTHEVICGACGAIASVVDIYDTYPRVKN